MFPQPIRRANGSTPLVRDRLKPLMAKTAYSWGKQLPVARGDDFDGAVHDFEGFCQRRTSYITT
jgi:hypothetical protein